MYLGIDSSSKAVHIVSLDGNGKIKFKVKLASKEPTAPLRFLELVDALFIYFEKPTGLKFVAVEQAIYVQNPQTTLALAKVLAAIEICLYKAGIEYKFVQNKTWKKEILKNGGAKKEDILAFAKNTWPKEDFNEQDFADSACIALWGLKFFKEGEI